MIWELGVTSFFFVHSLMTVIGTAISMGLMLPATTINHQPLRTTILVGIHDLILTYSDYHFFHHHANHARDLNS